MFSVFSLVSYDLSLDLADLGQNVHVERVQRSAFVLGGKERYFRFHDG